MASYNRVVLIGNVTRDIQLKYTAGGLAVTEIGLAMNDKRKNAQGEWVEEAVFVEVTLWGRTAEVASEYVSKGSPLFVEGRLKLDTWEKDGEKKSKLRVVGERIQLISSKGGGNGAPSNRRPESSQMDDSYSEAPSPAGRGNESFGDDEIPF
jgi:single-strand DNA-binding protein